MRKLMFLTIGFAAGCALGSYLLFGSKLLLLACVFLIAGCGLLFISRKSAIVAAFVIIGIGFGAGWSYLHDALYLQTARNYDGKTIQTIIEISDYSTQSQYGISADGTIKIDGKQYRVYSYLKCADLKPGDCVEGKFRLRFTSEGGQDDATYHAGKGIFLLAYADGETKIMSGEENSLRYFPAKLRRNIKDILDKIYPDDAVGFARALLLGDSEKLSGADDTAFKVSGIRHVIAVSGLHISILFSLVYVLFGKKRIPTALIGIPILIIFAAVAGFTPSVVRACIMQSLMIFSLLVKKEYDPPSALSFAVLVMLIANPLTITSVSFQLSVGSMLGIFLFCKKIYAYIINLIKASTERSFRRNIIHWLVGSISVTLSAMVFTTPLSAYYFGSVSIVGVFTNLVALWVISFVFYGSMAACVLGSIWLVAGKVLGTIIAWPIRYVLFVARTFSALPMSSVYTSSIYIVLWLIFDFVLIGTFLLMKRKHPLVLTSCVIFGLCICIGASHLEPKLDDFQVTVVDVGQGQSVILRSSDKVFVVDCGGDDRNDAGNIVAERLLSQGIGHIDGLILTHFDDDHAGGAADLLNRVPADRIYLPDCSDDGNLKAEIKEQFSDRIDWIKEKYILSGQWGKITFFPGDAGKDDNNGGLGILFQAETCDILITGDWATSVESVLVKNEELPQLELLVVGHHGSKYSTSFELLSETKPKAAVISVGEDNSFGHPSADVLNRLEAFGCEIWRTDLDGTVVFGR